MRLLPHPVSVLVTANCAALPSNCPKVCRNWAQVQRVTFIAETGNGNAAPSCRGRGHIRENPSFATCRGERGLCVATEVPAKESSTILGTVTLPNSTCSSALLAVICLAASYPRCPTVSEVLRGLKPKGDVTSPLPRGNPHVAFMTVLGRVVTRSTPAHVGVEMCGCFRQHIADRNQHTVINEQRPV